MWACPCGSQNDEDALACISCGRERDIQESAQEEYPSSLKEIEEAQRELEETTHHIEKEPIPAPTPVEKEPISTPTPFHKEAEKMEELRLDTETKGSEQSVYEEMEDLGKELGEVPPTAPKEPEEKPYEEFMYEEEEGSTTKKVLRVIDISVMCVIIVFVAIYAIIQIGGVEEARFSAYLSRCLGIWIRSIIITQAVLIIGGIIYFLLWEPKRTKVR